MMPNLAVYLDELDPDPIKACVAARDLGFMHVFLRRVWTTNITRASDDICRATMAALRSNNLSVAAICCDDGRAPTTTAPTLATAGAMATRIAAVAVYFRATMLRVHAGVKDAGVDTGTAKTAVDSWLTSVTEACQSHNLMPLLEVEPDSYAFEPSEIAAVLADHPQLRLLYDPALLVVRRNQDPFVRYWTLFKSRIAAIDIHDYKTGVGFVAAGGGSCRLADTISDCLAGGNRTWFAIEPGRLRGTSGAVASLDAVRTSTKAFFAMSTRTVAVAQSRR